MNAGAIQKKEFQIFRKSLWGLLFATSSTLAASDAASEALQSKWYGFFKSSVVGSSDMVSSAGRLNLTGPTYAIPGEGYGSNLPVSTFQVGQSRLGAFFSHSRFQEVKGQVEFDFLGGFHSTATTQLYPRLRVANISYKITPDHELEMGQSPELFAPARAYTYNFVSGFVYAGVLGGARPQLKFHSYYGDTTLSIALGMAQLNPNNSNAPNRDGAVTDGIVSAAERTLLPSVSFRLQQVLNENWTTGASAILGRHRFETVEINSLPIGSSTVQVPVSRATGFLKLRSFYGLNSYFKWADQDFFQMQGSLYYGQDLGAAGDLYGMGWSPGSRGYPTLHEAGGFLSLRALLGPDWGLISGVGIAKILESNVGGRILDFAQKKDYQLAQNMKWNVGLFFTLYGNLAGFAEYSYFNTRFYYIPTSAYARQMAHVGDVGLHYAF